MQIQMQEQILSLQRELKLANDAEVRDASSKVRAELSRIHSEDTERLLKQHAAERGTFDARMEECKRQYESQVGGCMYWLK